MKKGTEKLFTGKPHPRLAKRFMVAGSRAGTFCALPRAGAAPGKEKRRAAGKVPCGGSGCNRKAAGQCPAAERSFFCAGCFFHAAGLVEQNLTDHEQHSDRTDAHIGAAGRRCERSPSQALRASSPGGRAKKRPTATRAQPQRSDARKPMPQTFANKNLAHTNVWAD